MIESYQVPDAAPDMETKNRRQKNEEAFNKGVLFKDRSQKANEVFLFEFLKLGRRTLYSP